MSQMFSEIRDWEEIFLKFDRIEAQLWFKSVVSGVQDIEYTIDPTLQRWHISSLERIEIFIAFANSPRIEVLPKIRFFNFQGTDQVSHASY